MKLACAKYGINFDIKENESYVLVVESPTCMADIVSSIQAQCEGEDGIFFLSSENKEIKFPKACESIINPFQIDINDKKILNRLYLQIENNANDYLDRKTKINSDIITLLDDIIISLPYCDITYNLDFAWSSMLKLYDLKFSRTSGSLVERILDYIKICSELLNKNIFFLVDIKAYLTAEEIEGLYQSVFYNKIALILIESWESYWLDCEKGIIIDKDMCLIIK